MTSCYSDIATLKSDLVAYLDMAFEVVVSRKTVDKLQHQLTELLCEEENRYLK